MVSGGTSRSAVSSFGNLPLSALSGGRAVQLTAVLQTGRETTTGASLPLSPVHREKRGLSLTLDIGFLVSHNESILKLASRDPAMRPLEYCDSGTIVSAGGGSQHVLSSENSGLVTARPPVSEALAIRKTHRTPPGEMHLLEITGLRRTRPGAIGLPPPVGGVQVYSHRF